MNNFFALTALIVLSSLPLASFAESDKEGEVTFDYRSAYSDHQDSNESTKIIIRGVGTSQYCQEYSERDKDDLHTFSIGINSIQTIDIFEGENAENTNKMFCIAYDEKRTDMAEQFHGYGPFIARAGCEIVVTEVLYDFNDGGTQETSLFTQFIPSIECMPTEDQNGTKLNVNTITIASSRAINMEIHEKLPGILCEDVNGNMYKNGSIIYRSQLQTISDVTETYISIPEGLEYCVYTHYDDYDYAAVYHARDVNTHASYENCEFGLNWYAVEYYSTNECIPKFKRTFVNSSVPDNFEVYIYDKGISADCENSKDFGVLYDNFYLPRNSGIMSGLFPEKGNFCVRISNGLTDHYAGPFINNSSCEIYVSGENKKDVIINSNNCS